jgi:hypothetical protein
MTSIAFFDQNSLQHKKLYSCFQGPASIPLILTVNVRPDNRWPLTDRTFYRSKIGYQRLNSASSQTANQRTKRISKKIELYRPRAIFVLRNDDRIE